MIATACPALQLQVTILQLRHFTTKKSLNVNSKSLTINANLFIFLHAHYTIHMHSAFTFCLRGHQEYWTENLKFNHPIHLHLTLVRQAL